MYPYLFGNQELEMYNIIGVLGYIIPLFFFIYRKTWSADVPPGEKRRPSVVILPLAVHLIAYTFAGKLLGPLVNRGTEFFGYVAVSALGVLLAAVTLGGRPWRWLDATVPLYLAVASVLKLCCFCAGCCRGLPWAWGLENHRTQQAEFPIQLVEAALYALLLWLLCRESGRPGRRFSLFLVGYAGVRFVVQFFRADVEVFTPFHWLSVGFFALGAVGLLLCWLVPEKSPAPEQEE